MTTYNIYVNGSLVCTMAADFSDASCPLLLDDDSTPFQVADARHRSLQAANLLLEWAGADMGWSIDDDDVVTVDVATFATWCDE